MNYLTLWGEVAAAALCLYAATGYCAALQNRRKARAGNGKY